MTHQWFWVTRKTPPGGHIEPALIHDSNAWLTTWKEPLPVEDLQILGPCLPPEPQKLVRSVRFLPGYDKRSDKPSHGIHAMHILFLVKGLLGAIFFEINTGWLPSSVRSNGRDCPTCHSTYEQGWTPIGHSIVPSGSYSWGIGYHSKVPLYEGQTISSSTCEYCDGKACYSDSSVSGGDPIFQRFATEGEPWLWSWLEEEYERRLAHSNPTASEI